MTRWFEVPVVAFALANDLKVAINLSDFYEINKLCMKTSRHSGRNTDCFRPSLANQQEGACESNAAESRVPGIAEAHHRLALSTLGSIVWNLGVRCPPRYCPIREDVPLKGAGGVAE